MHRLLREIIRFRRTERGFALVGSLVAMTVMGALLVSVGAVAERGARRSLVLQAVAAAETVSTAAEAHLRANWETLRTQAAANPGRIAEIPLADLVTNGELAAGFENATRAFGTWGILVREVPIVGDSRLETLVIAREGDFSETEALYAAANGPFGAAATSARLGPGRIRGAGLDLPAAVWSSAATTLWGVAAPADGDVAFFASHHPSVLFGDALYRVVVPGRPELNRMDADLELGGNDLLGVDAVEAQTLEITDTLTVGGELEVTGRSTFRGALVAETDFQANGTATIGTARVTGDLDATRISVTLDAIRASSGEFQRLTVLGTCTGC